MRDGSLRLQEVADKGNRDPATSTVVLQAPPSASVPRIDVAL
jgi:hypothetical protein